MSDELYFGNGLPGFTSNSKLGLINPKQDGTVAKFNSGFEDSTSDFFKLGTAIHALVLEPDAYKLSNMIAPNGTSRDIIDTTHKLVSRKNGALTFEEALQLAITLHGYYGGKPGPKRTATLVETTAEYYRYISNSAEEGEIILDAEMKATAISCVKAVRENEKAYELLIDSDKSTPDFLKTKLFFNEDVLTCVYNRNGTDYNFKAKIDSWYIDTKEKVLCLTDLKTTGAQIENFMGRSVIEIQGFCDMVESYKHGSFHKYHYYRQMYMYLEMLKLYAAQEYGFDETWSVKVGMVVVETTNRNRCQVFEVTDDLLLAGQLELEYILDVMYESNVGEPMQTVDLTQIGFNM